MGVSSWNVNRARHLRELSALGYRPESIAIQETIPAMSSEMGTMPRYSIFYEAREDKRPRTALVVRTSGKVNIESITCSTYTVLLDLVASGAEA